MPSFAKPTLPLMLKALEEIARETMDLAWD
jgi:hypothetical protein